MLTEHFSSILTGMGTHFHFALLVIRMKNKQLFSSILPK